MEIISRNTLLERIVVTMCLTVLRPVEIIIRSFSIIDIYILEI